jgi:O-antigen/teichoic acid export membrane protein
VIPANDRSTFFRQSGWLMIANIGGGLLMWLVHFLNKFIPSAEYGVFGTFLTVVMLVPGMPLQMVFAQQTAKAIATNNRSQLSGLIRRAWIGTFLVWLVMAVFVLFFQNWILQQWKLTHAGGLWITLVAVLLSVWMYLFWGVMQGQQNFLWLGWSMISNGIGRIVAASLAVLLIHRLVVQNWYAPGMMAGVACGVTLAVGIAVWHTRGIWLIRPERFDWRSIARQVTPLLLAFFGFQILFTADTLFVQAYFPDQNKFYVSAGTLSRALMWLVGPLAAVMFPRLVQSAAKGEKQDLLGLVLVGTGVLAGVGALGLSLVGPLVVKIVYKENFVADVTALLPWYAGAMVPLSVANVLLNNLMSKPSSKVALGVVIFCLAIAFAASLTHFHRSLVQVLQVVFLFNTLLLIICGWFTWQGKSPLSENAA